MKAKDVAEVMGVEEEKVTPLYVSGYIGQFGSKIYFDDQDGAISVIWFTGGFPRDVAVYGLRIGMGFSSLLEAVPGLKLPPGASGKPGQTGAVTYEATLAPEGYGLEADVRGGEVVSLKLTRPNYRKWLAERGRHEAERRERERAKHERQNRWKTIADSDEMLESWAANSSPWGEASDKYVAFATWLRSTATPDQRHIVAQTWNWDYTHAPLLWIIRQPDCDVATALTVFFLGEPFFYVTYADRAAVPHHAVDVYDLLAEIRSRLDSGFYTRSAIAFAGEARMASVYRSKADRAAIQRWYPPQAGRDLKGRDLSLENNYGGVETPDFSIA